MKSPWKPWTRGFEKNVILTGNELRHRFFRKAVAMDEEISVLRTFCESRDKILPQVARQASKGKNTSGLAMKHLEARIISEEDFFGAFDRLTPERSEPKKISRGSIVGLLMTP